jgi:hypothetical protein
MHESDLAEAVETAFPLGRRKWVRRGAILVLFLLVLAAVPGYWYFAGNRHLQDALDQADRLDPDWRLLELEARRAEISDEQNAAHLIMASQGALPRGWPRWESGVAPAGAPKDEDRRLRALGESFVDLSPPVALTPVQVAALREELGRAAKALTEAHKLVETPRGRHPVNYTPDWLGTLYPSLQDTRGVSQLLAYEAMLRAHDGDLRGALSNCLAIVNAGRSVGDEPGFIGQLVRIHCSGVAVQTLERTLSQGQVAEADLASLQSQLEEEMAQPLFLIAARGERAGLDLLVAGVQNGTLPLSYVNLLRGESPGSTMASPLDGIRLMLPGNIADYRATLLEAMTELVEIAKLPVEQRGPRVEQLKAARPGQRGLADLLAIDVCRVVQRFQRNDAALRCAIAALAVERYRLRHGRWPESLDALVPDLLRAVPMDPFDGKPLRYRRNAEEVAVYSVGPDGKDDGGVIAPRDLGRKEGPDLGFRLWDVAARRRPAPGDKQAK